MILNKVCETRDLSDPDLLAVLRDLFPHWTGDRSPDAPDGRMTPGDWELAMPIFTLRRLGVLHRDAIVLVVAGGANDSIFYLTRYVRQVFVTDQYVGDRPSAPSWLEMLIEPSVLAPGEFEANRLVAHHMDPRALRFPDQTFDAVVSWRSDALAGLSGNEEVANAAYEMGRVLKPGGILALSVGLRLAGPPGDMEGATPRPLSADELQRYVISASGLEQVEALDVDVSEDSTAAVRHPDRGDADNPELVHARLDDWRVPRAGAEELGAIVASRGYVVGSVNLAMRRTDSYPEAPNEWARTSKAKLDALARANLRLLGSTNETLSRPDLIEAPPVPPARERRSAGSWADLREAAAVAAASVAADRHEAVTRVTDLAARRTESERHLDQVHRLQDEAEELLGSVWHLRRTLDGLSHLPAHEDNRVTPAEVVVDRSSWKVCRTSLPAGTEIRFVIDSESDDPVSAAFGEGGQSHLVSLMLDSVKPGDMVLDLGAHVGTFALSAAGAGCRVLAIEASLANVALLRASAAINRFRSLRVVHAAVGDHGGYVDFFAHGPWGHVVEPGGGGPRTRVPCVTVDGLVTELGIRRIDFVKMDIEGSEIDAIRGMRGLLEPPDAPPVIYESNGHTLAFLGTTPEELLVEFARLGYTSYMVEPPRLIRVMPGEWQPQTLVDYLAFKRPPETLHGWQFQPGLTFEERVQRIIGDCRSPNPDQRAYIAGALRRAPSALLQDPAVTHALASLTRDPVPAVRNAALWSSAPHGPDVPG